MFTIQLLMKNKNTKQNNFTRMYDCNLVGKKICAYRKGRKYAKMLAVVTSGW